MVSKRGQGGSEGVMSDQLAWLLLATVALHPSACPELRRAYMSDTSRAVCRLLSCVPVCAVQLWM